MSREEQIIEQAYEYMDTVPLNTQLTAFGDFINGAEWADENPREGLVDVNNLCGWLKENIIVFWPEIDEKDVEKFIDKLKKAKI